MNTMTQVYLDAQKGCGLKIGDWVKVLRRGKSEEGGWPNCWTGKMNTYIGKIGKVVSILDCGIGVDFKDTACCWNFPYFVLQKVNEKEKPSLQKGDYVKITKKAILNCLWNPGMDETVGKIGKVLHAYDDGTANIDVEGIYRGYFYPTHVLQKVDLEDFLKPGDPVLVRKNKVKEWRYDIFSHVVKYLFNPPTYVCIGGEYIYCIPYSLNQDLVGKNVSEAD